MAEARYFEVDTDELRAAGSAMVRTGDDVVASARRGILLAHGHYGSSVLDGAAGRFADRFSYLVRGLGDDVAETGVQLRGSAWSYDEQDANIAQSQLQPPMPY